MKLFTAGVLLAITGLASAGRALAWNQAMQANVPFAFTAGNKHLPAGTYLVSPESPELMRLQSGDRSIGIYISTTPNFGDGSSTSKLIFHKYGDQYFLNKVVSSTSSFNVEVPFSNSEKQAKYQQDQLRDQNQILISAK
jgi:hypothetical protein